MQTRLDAGLLRAYLGFRASNAPVWTIPGHKGRAADIDCGLGAATEADVPLYGGLDTVGLAHGRLEAAERAAAATWGAEGCRFLVNGSTSANHAAILAMTRAHFDGTPDPQRNCTIVSDEADGSGRDAALGGSTAQQPLSVVVQRTAHRSVLTGLVLAGLDPVWLSPEICSNTGVPLGVTEAQLAKVMAARPSTIGAILVEPGYLGTYSTGLPGIARMLHDEGKLLCVDSAWAPHLGFHPELPPHALAQGADLMVTSFHKTLPAVSGAAAVFARTGLLAQHLDPSVDALTTTSPPGAALASIDGCRALVDSPYGSELLGELLSRVNRLKEALRIAGVPLLEDSVDQQQSVARFDPTKVVVHASGFGASGIDVERRLRSVDMPVELADNDFLVPIISICDSNAAVERLATELITGLRQSSADQRLGRDIGAIDAWSWASVTPEAGCSLRDAFFRPAIAVPLETSVGRIAAETVCPYPPGIPVLVPGERITQSTLNAVAAAVKSGARLAYASDPSCTTIRVLR